MPNSRLILFLFLLTFSSLGTSNIGDIISSQHDSVGAAAYTEGDHAGIDEGRGLYLGANGYNSQLQVGDLSSVGSSTSYSINNLNGDLQDVDVYPSNDRYYFISSNDGNLVKWDFESKSTDTYISASSNTGSSVEVDDNEVYFANNGHQAVYDSNLNLISDLGSKTQDVVPIKVSDEYIFVGGPSTDIYDRSDYSHVASTSQASTSIAVSDYYDKVALVKDRNDARVYDFSSGSFNQVWSASFTPGAYVGGAGACDEHLFTFFTSNDNLKTFDVKDGAILDTASSGVEALNGIECGYSQPDESFYAVLRGNDDGFDVFRIDGKKFNDSEKEGLCDDRGPLNECIMNETNDLESINYNVSSVFEARENAFLRALDGKAIFNITNSSVLSGSWRGSFSIRADNPRIKSGAYFQPENGNIVIGK